MAENKIEKISKDIEGLNALELSELAKHLEDVFGVTAAPMMAAGPAASASAEVTADKEEKTHYDVILTDGGANKLAAIKAVRELKPDLGLMDAKKLVETPPQTVLTQVKKEEAEAGKAKLEEAGAKVELK
ncbi:50S ribosomal protein L7/L12 [Candidatus Roizmanbacteria bacterium RIFCSPHIGHO2_02_FULL_40_13b]|uniref:Large ribosomal subunit protein bL12 n=1 Tax=Candidatus Roizmanbacteria bacterium RIFCSPHIGHO2_01_FULL_39_24 TaxID=1802032 RepID=A0A1F7GES1_9BACT|nr:MAG: 50S ribosomal protein L7/L12 [Candidatus Roizmanbacteria bacterium RIFCSPHIGHO2_01_FULL_39_24]OGK27889.1 MAG: 50S ribosomal protein L7/L12 [Candidatus Roizmanbacteria bacterium RIFCSPHIGHO2_02_FULL_40_13b]OGK49813.1 MAG: 50S ribosomal protein L7/L12 [Candidatus Roizmanbacteria bacterium RIFCSPLOWO2_01_FULL_40_32]OGK57259.1 MAG: 50S ribosomal protein L7/L12 [Candidatus Roizmanbacteria bacterium RIFCSPLOWO2_02_FULL_39_8]